MGLHGWMTWSGHMISSARSWPVAYRPQSAAASRAAGAADLAAGAPSKAGAWRQRDLTYARWVAYSIDIDAWPDEDTLTAST